MTASSVSYFNWNSKFVRGEASSFFSSSSRRLCPRSSTMFFKICRPCRDGSQISSSIISSSSSSKLKEGGFSLFPTLEILQERELVLQSEIALELDRAKKFMRENNREAAMKCLRRTKHYESKMKQLEVFQSFIRNQEQKLVRFTEVAKFRRQQTLI